MFKVIGFYIGNKEKFICKKARIVDINSSQIKTCEFIHFSNFIKIWYIGTEINNEDKLTSISMSPFANENLLDRNVIINFYKKLIIIENDWLGSIPVFYNIETNEVSTYSELVFSNENEIDIKGLLNYFDAGFCLYGHTQFKNIKFLRYYSKLTIANNIIKIEEKEDVVFKNSNIQSNPADVLEKIKNYILKGEKYFDKKIILPLSGGYDSRLLSSFVSNKNQILSFTYGISKKQESSYEVVYAKKLSQQLEFSWKQIELSDFNNYINKWHCLFGFSTHLHGMYQMEFYDKIIKNCTPSNCTVLSGIIGDAWSGKIKFIPIDNFEQLNNLTYSHGMNLDKKYYNNKNNIYSQNEFHKNKKIYLDEKYQIVQRMRNKIILLNYLLSVPEHYGLISWTPFLNFDIVDSMLSLSENDKVNRVWQTNYFKENGLDFEKMTLKKSMTNTLNYDSAKKFKFDLLSNKKYANLFDEKIIYKINTDINKNRNVINFFIENKLKYHKILNKIFGYRSGFYNTLYQYYTLKSIDLTINKHE